VLGQNNFFLGALNSSSQLDLERFSEILASLYNVNLETYSVCH
jgi:hypothetical protein